MTQSSYQSQFIIVTESEECNIVVKNWALNACFSSNFLFESANSRFLPLTAIASLACTVQYQEMRNRLCVVRFETLQYYALCIWSIWACTQHHSKGVAVELCSQFLASRSWKLQQSSAMHMNKENHHDVFSALAIISSFYSDLWGQCLLARDLFLGVNPFLHHSWLPH